MFDQIIDFVLENIGIVVFALFVLSGFLGRGDRKKKAEGESQSAPQQSTRQEGDVDDRPLAERLAEAFGVEIPQEETAPQTQSQSRDERYGSAGRRSTETRNVQQEYPQLFGGSGMFDSREDEEASTKWGFDETEWGTTFEKSEEQWGNSFPERKSSEPRVEWPS